MMLLSPLAYDDLATPSSQELNLQALTSHIETSLLYYRTLNSFGHHVSTHIAYTRIGTLGVQ